ncbi:MAG TPA: hypothetical protein VL978_08465 [Puia sp.]|nr:hypothetical protein [Puia sp.]
MRWLFILLVFCGLMGLMARAYGQSQARPGSGVQPGPVVKSDSGSKSVLHTKWKTYYLPITDTIEVTFGADSMAVTTSTGAALLQSTFKLTSDVLTLHDYGGVNMCADLAGTYHVRIRDDTLILVMDEDPCDTRGGTLIAKRWIRVPAPPAAAGMGKKKKKRG